MHTEGDDLLDPTPPRELVDRIRMDYVEMPGLALTGPQARRLWNLDGGLCDAVLVMLVRERFLARQRSGAYIRATAPR